MKYVVVLVLMFSVEVVAEVDIPDSNLRAMVAAALDKTLDDPITVEDMETLTRIGAPDAGIADLTGLEFATNLRSLGLGNNIITDITPLADLTRLKELGLFGNDLTDITLLSGLTNLTSVGLHNNAITDITPLSGLTNLISVGLHNNAITDITPLSGLTNLRRVSLHTNAISDIAPLVENMGLSAGDKVDIRNNPLNAESIDMHIPALEARSVEVIYNMSIDIPDLHLRAAIEQALGKNSDSAITTVDMGALMTLQAPNANISDLTGLEHAISLETIDLGVAYVEAEGWVNSNSISDLSPLSQLTEGCAWYVIGRQRPYERYCEVVSSIWH